MVDIIFWIGVVYLQPGENMVRHARIGKKEDIYGAGIK
jgi:hypothetical protein